MLSIEIQGMRLQRGGRVLAELPQAHVRPGEFIALIGPNGAGKSTVIRALTGEWPAQGSIRLMGRPLAAWSRQDLAQRMAVMPQQSHLTFDFTVQEVVALGRLPHRGESAQQTRQAVHESLQCLSLEAFAHRRFTTLSGGERQRVQFARVMAQLWGVRGPSLLLLDEPTSALDLAQQQVVLDQAWRLAQTGTSVVAVMHDLNMVCRYAQRVWVMQQAGLVFDGDAADFMSSDNIRQVFDVHANVEVSHSDGLPVLLICPGREPASDAIKGVLGAVRVKR